MESISPQRVPSAGTRVVLTAGAASGGRKLGASRHAVDGSPLAT